MIPVFSFLAFTWSRMHWEATYPDATPFLKLTTLTQLSVISRMVC